MIAEIPASGADVFHHLVDRGIRRTGGPGSHGQLIIRSNPGPEPQALADALRRLGRQAPLLRARWIGDLRGPRWRFASPATHQSPELLLECGTELDQLAAQHLRSGLVDGWLIRFGHAPEGIVVTWDHRLIDARGVMGLIDFLPRLAAGERLNEAWWQLSYRDPPDLPPTHAGRGQLARSLLPLIRQQRLARIWRPCRAPAGGPPSSGPYVVVDLALGTETAVLDARIRATTGRFGETAFLLAALAGALEACGGIAGDLLFPLAVDIRAAGQARLLSNHHGFSMLLVPEGSATADLRGAALQIKAAQRAWLVGDGVRAMASSLSYFHYLGARRGQFEIGNRKSGVWASCLVANTGQARLSADWFGGAVSAIDHRITVPDQPGLAAIFSRDARGAGVTLIATAAVAQALDLSAVRVALRHQLIARELSAVSPGSSSPAGEPVPPA